MSEIFKGWKPGAWKPGAWAPRVPQGNSVALSTGQLNPAVINATPLNAATARIA